MFEAWFQWSVRNYNWKGHLFGPQTVLPILILIVGFVLVRLFIVPISS